MPSKRESSARVDYVPALCTHRPSLLPIERFSEVLGLLAWRFTLPRWWKDDQTVALRGSKSRNKVSVGEPAEGSLSICYRCFGRGRNDTTSGCFAALGPRLACRCPPSRAERLWLPGRLRFPDCPSGGAVRRCRDESCERR